MQSKRIVVTGGAGFLGSHLCDLLLDTGAEVMCLDCVSQEQRRSKVDARLALCVRKVQTCRPASE
jgi:nucleoside-diphosphate-sugar epimerase